METKVITKPLHKTSIEPSPRVLGSLIKLIEQEVDIINSYKELAELINNRFNVDITEEDVFKFYIPYLAEKEAEHMKHYGYEIY